MKRSEIILLWILCVITRFVAGQSGTDMKNLYTYLFTTLGYNKDIRPKQNQNEVISVSVELLLTGLHGLDETKQQMTSVGVLTIKWRDDYLSWTPSSYGGATYIDVPQGLVWKPDLQVQNGLTDFAELGGSFMNLRVSNAGDVTWMPYKVFDTKCKIDTTFFPFDQQECSIKLVAWNSDASTVNITKGTNAMQIDGDFSNGQWTMSSPTADVIIDDNDSVIILKVKLDRKPKIYVLNIIIPMLFLIILDVFTFTLPNDSGEKMSYSVTVFLSISIFMTIIANLLPPTSHSTSYLEIYILLDVALGTLILVITAISLRIHNWTKEREIPSWVKMLTILSWRLQCRPAIHSIDHDENTVSQIDVTSYNEVEMNVKEEKDVKQHNENSGETVLWTDVTSAIDFYMFFLFLFIILLSTAICFGLSSSA